MIGSIKEDIRQYALSVGFSLAGFIKPGKTLSYHKYKQWIAAGYHAEMGYLAREDALLKREDTRSVFGEGGVILVLGFPYPSPIEERKSSLHPGTGRVASYAWGLDYHDVIPEKARQIVEHIEVLLGTTVAHKSYTDTGPILERDLAVQAGLGWIGRNSCLINPSQGSFFLLATLYLDLDLPADAVQITDHCGSCSRCVKACPTACIKPDRTIDAAKCISYLTIENKGLILPGLARDIPEELFGCDICQSVCPWNIRFSSGDLNPALTPINATKTIDLDQLIQLTPQEFNKKYKNSPIKRAKRRGMIRNAITLLSKDPTKPKNIQALLGHDEELVREQARLALNEERK